MGVLRTSLLVLFLGLGAASASEPVIDQARQFATCLGRYSAEMEHRHLMGEPAERPIQRRAVFVGLLDAVQPDVRDRGLSGPVILSLQIEAKHAQARLLQMASFNGNARLARNARAQARRQLRSCDMLVLG